MHVYKFPSGNDAAGPWTTVENHWAKALLLKLSWAWKSPEYLVTEVKFEVLYV